MKIQPSLPLAPVTPTPAPPPRDGGPRDAFQPSGKPPGLPDLARAASLFKSGTEPLWTSQRDGYFTAPSTAPDGTVLAGHSDHSLYGLDPKTGATRWTYPTDSILDAAPVAGPDGRLYATGRDRHLHILAPDGTGLAKVETGLCSSAPAVDREGRVLVATVEGEVKAFDPQGRGLWNWKLPGRHGQGFTTSPVLGPDGTIFCASRGGQVSALDPASGQARWSTTPGFGIESAGVVGPEGNFYAPCDDGTIHCLDGATGKRTWSVTLDGPLSCSPVLREGRLWALSLGGQLACLRTGDGGIEWTAEMGGSVREDRPVLGKDDTLFVNDEEKNDVVALEASSGLERWRLHLEGILGSGAVSPDGSTLYLRVGQKGLAAVPTRTVAQRLESPEAAAATPGIRKEETHVVIGGIRLPRRQGS